MFEQERLENAISYFAREHKRRSGETLTSLRLYKYIALLQHWGIETHGKPVFGLTFSAMRMGPVPLEIYDKRNSLARPLFKFIKYSYFKPNAEFDGGWCVVANGEPDLTYFSKQEITEMNRLLEIYAHRGVSSQDMSDASHEVIRAWKKAWKTKPNSIIDWGLTFSSDPQGKKAEDLSPEEENYLLSLAFKGLRGATAR
ncbi:MAG: hypothetical protein BWY82_00084 [Verrucomicrobia bacterium ADurb.Bin474]|nr:MAG: hypothetical protein BWY82_00084 [Verrucomicrobia bacterium ADurb.Bin474]